ncbi:MAG: helix-turn-helix domain-containing protein [bacterium]
MAENIGKQLQEARRRKEISLQHVSEETKINKRYLEALEKEEYDVFPAKVYVVSFIRSYARYLGLDAEALLHIYKREHSGRKDKMNLNPEFPIVVSQGGEEKSVSRGGIAAFRFTRNGLIPFILAIGVIVAAGLLAIFWLRLALRQLSPQMQAGTIVSTNVPQNISMVVEIHDETWLRVVGDGVVSFEGILFPGENRTWVAKDGMNVRIGNVEGVKLYVNGKEVDTISGNSGRVNELVFTRLRGKDLIKMEQRRFVREEKVLPVESELQEEENK